MKRILLYFICLSLACLYSCDDMFKTIEDQVPDERVYPAKLDTTIVKIGYERAEIDLLRAGRIPSGEIKLGKAKKTVVEYNDQRIVIDSVCSWVNVTGLTQQRLYRIRISTLDEYDNQSIPIETTVTPYTSEDIKSLVVVPPRLTTSPWMALVEWTDLSSIQFDYYGAKFAYTDENNVRQEGAMGLNPQFFIENVPPGQPVTVDMTYRVVPKVNGDAILDTVEFTQPFLVELPSIEKYRESLINRQVNSILFSENGRSVSVTMNPVSNDATMKYTTLRYTNTAGVETSVRVENDATTAELPGLKTGTSCTLTSTFNPVGAGEDLVDAFPSTLKVPEQLKLSFADWTVMSGSDETATGGNNIGKTAVIDGNINTFWHTAWDSPAQFPHWVVIDMGQSIVCNIISIEAWRSPEFWYPDTKTVQFFVSDNSDPEGNDWVQIAEGSFTGIAEFAYNMITINIPNGVNADYGRYLKVVLPDNWGRGTYASLAEFFFYGKNNN